MRAALILAIPGNRCIVPPPDRSRHRERYQTDPARRFRAGPIDRAGKNPPARSDRPHRLDLAGRPGFGLSLAACYAVAGVGALLALRRPG